MNNLHLQSTFFSRQISLFQITKEKFGGKKLLCKWTRSLIKNLKFWAKICQILKLFQYKIQLFPSQTWDYLSLFSKPMNQTKHFLDSD